MGPPPDGSKLARISASVELNRPCLQVSPVTPGPVSKAFRAGELGMATAAEEKILRPVGGVLR